MSGEGSGSRKRSGRVHSHRCSQGSASTNLMSSLTSFCQSGLEETTSHRALQVPISYHPSFNSILEVKGCRDASDPVRALLNDQALDIMGFRLKDFGPREEVVLQVSRTEVPKTAPKAPFQKILKIF